MVDNLLDLTHLAFVHETTIGNSALAEHAVVKVTRAPNNVVVTRWIIDQEPPPTFKKVGGFTGNVDRWQIIDFVPPAFLRLDVGATPTGTGAPEGTRVGGINMRNLNAITPETETTSHYFWGQAHDFDVNNPETTNKIFEQIPDRVPRGRRGVFRSATQPGPDAEPAAGRHQRRHRRDPGAPHPLAAVRRGTGGPARDGRRIGGRRPRATLRRAHDQR